MNRCGLCFVVEKDEMRRRRRTKSVMHGRGRVASPCRGARTLHEGNCDFALCAGFCFSPTLSPSPCWRSFSVASPRSPHNIYPRSKAMRTLPLHVPPQPRRREASRGELPLPTSLCGPATPRGQGRVAPVLGGSASMSELCTQETHRTAAHNLLPPASCAPRERLPPTVPGFFNHG